jgi:hypothetical protein
MEIRNIYTDRNKETVSWLLVVSLESKLDTNNFMAVKLIIYYADNTGYI